MSRVAGRSQLRAGSLVSYATVALDAVAGLIYTPWMVSAIGGSNYGLYTLALSLVNLFLLDFGLGSAVSKYLSEYYAKGRYDEANRFLGAAYKLYALVAAAVCVVLVGAYFLIGVIYTKLTPAELMTFKVLYAIVATYSVLSFPFLSFSGILLSNERFVALKSCAFLQKLSTILLIVGALYFGGGVYSLVAVNAGVGIVFILVRYAIIRGIPHVRPVSPGGRTVGFRGILGFSGWVTVAQIAQRLIFNVTPTILGAVSGSHAIAVFGLASSLEGYVFVVSEALNGLFLPKVSRIVSQDGSQDGLLDLMVRVGRLQTYILGLIVLGFVCFGYRFVLTWMGSDYTLVYYCTVILMLPALIDLPQQIGRTAVLATNNVRAQAHVYVAMVFLNVVLTIGLARLFGVVGACISICIAYAARTFGMNLIYRRALAVDVGAFFRRTYGSWLVPAGLSLGFGGLLEIVLAVPGWTGIALKAAAFSLVYMFLMHRMAFDAQERALLVEIVPLPWRAG